MAQTRLLSQISSLHATISNLKQENRRLEQRANASRAYARTVEGSTFITTHTTTNLFDRNTTTTSTSAFPRISSTSSIKSNAFSLPPSSSSSSSSSMISSASTNNTYGGGSNSTAVDNPDVEQLERDNLYYRTRIQELEEQLQNAPKVNEILQSHAAASSTFLGEREKKMVENINKKLGLVSAELNKLKEKRKRVSLKEKIMIEIETGRVGSRKDPVPALTKRISSMQVQAQFLKETSNLIKTLLSELQTTKNKTARIEDHLKKQLSEKRTQILNQGLRLRQYEQESSKRRAENASMMMSPIEPLSIVLNSLETQNRIDTPAGSIVLMPKETFVNGGSGSMENDVDVNDGSVGEIARNSGGEDSGSGSGVTSVTILNGKSTKSKLEKSLQHVGGLPPMGAALVTDAPHLIPPHMLPSGGTNGDPRDNGRPGSNSSKGRRDKWLYDQKGSFKKAIIPEMFQISTGRRDPLTGKIAWKNNGIFNRFDAIELFAGRTRNIYRQ